MMLSARFLQQVFEYRHYAFNFARFVEKVIGSGTQTFFPVLWSRKVREHDDFGRLWGAFNVSYQLHSASLWHSQIQNCDVRCKPPYQFGGIIGVVRLSNDLDAFQLCEQFSQTYPDKCRIIDDKNFHEEQAGSGSTATT